MYEIFQKLLDAKGETAYKVSKETGISTATLTQWKKGTSTPKADKMQKIADHFGVTLNYLMAGKEEIEKKETTLTTKDEKDIKKKLDKMMEEMKDRKDGPLYYNGQPISDESIEMLSDAIEFAMRHMKPINKEKYNPNKNKK